MGDKIFGYFLLFFGIAIIAFSGFQVYSLFTKRIEPVEIFNFSGVSIDTGQIVAESLPEEFAQIVKGQSQPQKTEVLTPDMLNKPLNIFAYVVFMGFMSSIGFKIAQLGAIMVRPAKVELKEQTIRRVANAVKSTTATASPVPPKKI